MKNEIIIKKLENLIKDFSKETLINYLGIISSFKNDEEDLDYLFNEEIFNKYESILKLGEATIGDDDLIVVLSKTNDPLTERSGKKNQYDIAKKILKHEVKDAALFIFYDVNGNFRFSFVKANYLGNKREFTNFKRYTYFVSPNQTNKTFISQISNCKYDSLENIIKAFSVEPLNKEFYQNIAKYFYSLIGGKIKIGTKTFDFEPSLVLPSTPLESNKKVYQEFAVRLIGRTIFCWFLKNKKSNDNLSLIPENWLSSFAVNNNYYHSILEKLFFLVLNKKNSERKDSFELLENHSQIPFLNGGLFEPQSEDFYNDKESHALIIPDSWFKELFETLEQFNFTIDENSINDSEVSIDPEMLGTIFENLLAEIDPDTEKSARKATGSFYTPREIVDYMVEQSLVQYLKTMLNSEEEDKILNLFKEGDKNDFNKDETNKILDALSNVKILDPACGSGAFPMGALHKIINALQKLDPDASWWKKRQIDNIPNALARSILKEKLDGESADYIRKLGVIQNSIYGVDIQPIAIEISKLRSFLSLVIDETIDDNNVNRGIQALPNLEFKFVTANTLIGLEEKDISVIDFGQTDELQDQLTEVRDKYLQSYGVEKEKLKTEFKEIQEKIFEKEIKNSAKNQRANQLMSWKPFSNESNSWFDPYYMFGIKEFDIVIGNPPYGANLTTKDKELFKNNYFSAKTIKKVSKGNTDSFVIFIEAGLNFIGIKGNLIYIVPLSVTSSESNTSLHNFINKNCSKSIYSNYSVRPQQIFLNAMVNTSIMQLIKKPKSENIVFSTKMYRKSISNNIENILNNIKYQEVTSYYLNGRYPKVSEIIEIEILKKLNKIETKIKDLKNEDGNLIFYRFAGGRYYKVITNYPTNSSAERKIRILKKYTNIVGAILSSNLYFWYYQIYSDNLNLKKEEVESFPIPINEITENKINVLNNLYENYLKDIEFNSNFIKTENYNNISQFKEYKIGKSKNLIDKIDKLIYQEYGLTEEEIEFIINYEIEFRVDL